MTYFEIVTMLALLEFREQGVTHAVIEVGMGGRLDATNILPGENVLCTAIVSIGRDHCDILGNDLNDIACEKAGIIKSGIGGCVVGPTASPFAIFRQEYEQSGSSLDNFIEIGTETPEESKEDITFHQYQKVSSESFNSYIEANNEIARRVLCIALGKTFEEFVSTIP